MVSGDLTPLQSMASSGIGAVCTSLMMTPFDVIKTRLQAQGMYLSQAHKPIIECNTCYLYNNGLMDHIAYKAKQTPGAGPAVTYNPAATAAAAAQQPPAQPSKAHFQVLATATTGELGGTGAGGSVGSVRGGVVGAGTGAGVGGSGAKVQLAGTWDAFNTIRKNEGVASLWRGLPPTLLMAVPQTVIYFTAYDELKEYLEGINPDKAYTPLMAGSLSRIFAVTIISPIEMVRTKMQATGGQNNNVTATVRAAVRNEGWLSLWRGLGATLLRDVPFSAVYWTGYEYFKSKWSVGGANSNPLDVKDSFLAGGISGTVAATLTLPADVVKTHMQVELGQSQTRTIVCKCTNTTREVAVRTTKQVVQDILRTQGVRGLFVGLIPRVTKVAPACGIMISSYVTGPSSTITPSRYEYCKDYFRQKNLDDLYEAAANL